METRTARSRLAVRGKPYYRSIETGCHVGYRRGKKAGKWVVRILAGPDLSGKRTDPYIVETIGTADDVSDADGVRILDWKQAQDLARDRCTDEARKAAGVGPAGPYTVKNAINEYLEDYTARGGKALTEINYRVNNFINPRLGKKEVSDLKTDEIRKWHRKLSQDPPRLRSSKKSKKLNVRDTSGDPDAERKRRHSANKVLTILKAALNYAWREGKVVSDEAWRRVAPFKGVDAPRIRYLNVDESKRLINASETGFRKLVQAALLTGCRYGELSNLLVHDFNPDSGSVHIQDAKSGRGRHVVLTEEGSKFFMRTAAGREGDEIMLKRSDGNKWGKSHQKRPMDDACKTAKIKPAISFHILRHSYASHLVMNGTPLQVVAENLGHADTRMTERHYAHLSRSYVADAIQAGAMEIGIEPDNVEQLRQK